MVYRFALKYKIQLRSLLIYSQLIYPDELAKLLIFSCLFLFGLLLVLIILLDCFLELGPLVDWFDIKFHFARAANGLSTAGECTVAAVV